MERTQMQSIISDLKKKIVFLVGPRQVGKTWLAKEIGRSFEHTVYLNYDRREDREIIKQEAWLPSTELLILDELHKMPDWKNYLKGIFDTKTSRLKILITGSARLDAFRRAGDSLAGRFFVHHLLPVSPKEAHDCHQEVSLSHFLERGGFPEPFLALNAIEADRWRTQYADGLVRTDVLDFENIHNFRSIQLLLDLLRERVGSLVSYTSLARDVGIAPNTVKKYIQIFEALYIVFRVTPFAKNVSRSLIKEPKLYFFDTGLVVGDDSKRLENLVAVCILKHVYGLRDQNGKQVHLHFLRNKEGKEVDFCVVEKGRPSLILEVKNQDPTLAKSLLYFHKKYHWPALQLVMNLKRERKSGTIEIRDADRFLKTLYL